MNCVSYGQEFTVVFHTHFSMLLLFSTILVLRLPWMVHALKTGLNECPDGWDEYALLQGRDRICYKRADGTANYIDAKAACPALHEQAKLVMPKTAGQQDVLNNYYNGDEAMWIGLEETGDNTNTYKWLDGEALGEWNSWHPDDPTTSHDHVGGCVAASFKNLTAWVNVKGTGEVPYVCQIVIKEWSCLEDGLKEAHHPFNHYAHQALGCRQVLTCSSRTVGKDGALVNGLTVNLQQTSYSRITAEIDLNLQSDLIVSIAFTEGRSSRSKDGKATCDAESLGLFLTPNKQGHASLNALGLGNGHAFKFQQPRALFKEVTVSGGVKATFDSRRVEGFTSLAELAGRSVVVCPSDKVEESGGFMRCLSDAIPVCCSLSWALEADEQFLQ